MAKQTITIRLDEEDLAFLSTLELAGTANLSEKVRALLAEARAQRDGMRDPVSAYDFTRRLFSAPERSVRDAEVQGHVRSELIARLAAWLPDISAVMLSVEGLSSGTARERADQLRKLERSLGERALSLTESLLQMSLAGFPGCYESESLTRRAQPALRTAAMHPTRPSKAEEHGS